MEWAGLPQLVDECAQRWGLELGPPYEGGVGGWVAPATQADGTLVVLKVQFPHREAEHEADALRRWDGNGAVRLLDHDRERHALLLGAVRAGHAAGSVPTGCGTDGNHADRAKALGAGRGAVCAAG